MVQVENRKIASILQYYKEELTPSQMRLLSYLDRDHSSKTEINYDAFKPLFEAAERENQEDIDRMA